jgi:hypothetical protein
MPRHSGAQPGAMVTERDHWSAGTTVAIAAAVVVALVGAYVLWS